MDERRGENDKERKRDRERRGSETDMPKLYPTMNMNSLWYTVRIGIHLIAS